MPRISVIVPVHNVESYLKECIESVLNQSYEDYELLLIDDGSKDASGEICDRYAQLDHRVRVYHQENRGVSAARNYGMSVASGRYITFLDSDDWLSSTFFQNAIEVCEESNPDIYMAGFVRVYPNGHEQLSCIAENFEGFSDALSEESFSGLLKNNYSAHTAGKLIKREVACSCQFVDQKLWGEDLEYVFSLMEQHLKIIAKKDPVYYYRVGQAGLISMLSMNKVQQFVNVYTMLYNAGGRRGFHDEGAYFRFLDIRFYEDLLYFEHLILGGTQSVFEKKQMLRIVLNIPVVLKKVNNGKCKKHLILYREHTSFLLVRYQIECIKRWICATMKR